MCIRDSLTPRIAMRKDEIADESAKLCVQPDMEALNKYIEKKKQEAELLAMTTGNISISSTDVSIPNVSIPQTSRVVLSKKKNKG